MLELPRNWESSSHRLFCTSLYWFPSRDVLSCRDLESSYKKSLRHSWLAKAIGYFGKARVEHRCARFLLPGNRIAVSSNPALALSRHYGSFTSMLRGNLTSLLLSVGFCESLTMEATNQCDLQCNFSLIAVASLSTLASAIADGRSPEAQNASTVQLESEKTFPWRIGVFAQRRFLAKWCGTPRTC